MKFMQFIAASGLFLLTAAANANGADDFAFVQGVWSTQTSFVADDGSWSEPVNQIATGQSLMGGNAYELLAAVPFPGTTFTMRFTLGYDRFNEVYRVVVLDDINGFIDVYAGQADSDGVIVLDNLSTGTGFPDGAGGFVFGRLHFSRLRRAWKSRPISLPMPVRAGAPICGWSGSRGAEGLNRVQRPRPRHSQPAWRGRRRTGRKSSVPRARIRR